MPKKGRARRFREARQLKQGFDDGLFKESGKSLADVDDGDDDTLDDDEEPWSDTAEDDEFDWDPDRARD